MGVPEPPAQARVQSPPLMPQAPSSSTASSLEHALHWVAALGLLVLPIRVLLLLHRGIDVTDTGYYHVSIAHLDQITMQTTQFAVVWNLLPLPDDVVVHRVVLWGLLLGASAWLAWEAWSLVHERPTAGAHTAFVLSVGPAATITYYLLWLPDPSYNAIGYVQVLLLLAASCRLLAVLRQGRRPAVVTFWAGSIGFVTAGLAINRAPAGLVMAATLPILIVLGARPSSRRVGECLAAALAGGALFVAASGIVVEPFGQTLARLEGGLDRREVLARPQTVRLASVQLLTDIMSATRRAWASVLLLAAGLFLTGTARVSQGRRLRLVVGTSAVVVGLGICFASFWAASDGLTSGNLTTFPSLVLPPTAGMVLAAIARWVNGQINSRGQHERPGSLDRDRLLLVAMLLVGQFSAVAGTSNRWFTHMSWFSGMVLLGFVVVASAPGVRHRGRVILPVASVALLLVAQVFTWNTLDSTPYRLASSMDQQSVPTPLRAGHSTLLVDPLTSAFLNELARGAARVDFPPSEPPILLDFTAAHPLAVYHLRLRPAFSPWLLSGPPGSAELFERTVADIDDRQISRAWVLLAADRSHGFDLTALHDRGRSLSRDYVVVAEAESPYLRTNVQLLVPRASVLGQ